MRKLFVIAAISLLSLSAQFAPPSASTSTGELPADVYRIGGGVSPPRLIKKISAEYSKEARLGHLEGTVLIQAVVTAKGRARDFKIVRPLGLGLDENAIKAVSGWEFSPGLLHGEPVNVLADFEINFHWEPREPTDWWRVRRIDFQVPEGASRPILEKVAAPQPGDAQATPTVRLTFDIDEQGVPVHVAVYDGANEGFSREVAAALTKWRFKPASQGGHPIVVSCTIDFVRGG